MDGELIPNQFSVFQGAFGNVRLTIRIGRGKVSFSCPKDKVLEALLDCERSYIAIARGHSRSIVTLDGIEPRHWWPITKSYASHWFRLVHSRTLGRAETERRIAKIKADFAPYIEVARKHKQIKSEA